VSGWNSLTDTERLVADLVAAGRTNPQVAAELLISRRTVESHLYRIFFKLGVANRTELAVQAMNRG
jgi:DNA-binding CsgD family transcriptional regulator